MRIHQRNSFQSVSTEFSKRVVNDVLKSLDMNTDGKDFIGNDTLWFQRNPQGKVTPTALNSAHFISKTFLGNLSDRGWTIEKTIDGQTFDAYFEAEEKIAVYDVHISDFPSVIEEIWKVARKEHEYPTILLKTWRELIQRGARIKDDLVPESLYEKFSVVEKSKLLRVGLEFETGNIASCFRSVTKLGGLYQSDRIDYGILVTFQDKANSACRLFPTSNRNGSFEELDKRQFRSIVDFPLWEVGFEPDGYDQSAPYLGNRPGKYFFPTPDGDVTIKGVNYDRYRSHDGREILKPKLTAESSQLELSPPEPPKESES